MSTTNINAAANKAAFFRLIHHPFKYRLFLFSKLPAAYFSGLKVEEISEERSVVSVPFKWFTQNPFRSTYFACLSMAAEMSTGILALSNIYQRKPSASMLITSMEAKYFKKATGKTRFVCGHGIDISNAVEAAYATSAPQEISVQSRGYNAQGEIVAHFWFTWSFKVKQ